MIGLGTLTKIKWDTHLARYFRFEGICFCSVGRYFYNANSHHHERDSLCNSNSVNEYGFQIDNRLSKHFILEHFFCQLKYHSVSFGKDNIIQQISSLKL